MAGFKIGNKVKIIGHSDTKYNGKIGTLLKAETPRPAIKGQTLKWKICKVKLDKTSEVVDCLLSQLEPM